MLGFNPGGVDGILLSESINRMLTNTGNSYLDEAWTNQRCASLPGKALLQQRVCGLLESLKANPRDVCASNLIFFQSRSAKDIDFNHAKKCLPVHEAIIKLIQPKLIIAFGNGDDSTYSYIRNHYNPNVKVDENTPPSEHAEHGNWKLKGFNTTRFQK